jgi:ADP-heptose:LPS heptosyltransferase
MTAAAEKILVIKHGAFGDIVQADGVLRDIRARHPRADIHLLTTPPYRRLMMRCPHVDQVLVDARAPVWRLGVWLSLGRQLRSLRFAKVYDLQNSDRTTSYRRLFLRHIPWCGNPPGLRHASALLGLVERLQRDGMTIRYSLAPDVGWIVDDVSALLRKRGVKSPYIALIPGSSARHPQKRWPYYAQLATALMAHGYDVVTAPGPDERDLAQSIPGHVLMAESACLNWFELAGVLKSARFVVGNDTGPSHIASCLGVPGLALFGPHGSSERANIRRGEFHAIDVPDLAALSVELVLAAVLGRLEAPDQNAV